MMTDSARLYALRGSFTRSGNPASAAMGAPCASDEPTLDELFTEPIVQQLMRRDRIDEGATRRLLQLAAVARAVPKAYSVQSAPRAKGVLALAIGLLLLIGIRHAWDATIRTLIRR
jgi:plasmid replication initiation protein